MISVNSLLHKNEKSSSKPSVRHVIRLKQCTTASVVSRMLKQDPGFNVQNDVKQPCRDEVIKKAHFENQNHAAKFVSSPRYELSSEAASRRSRVIEMCQLGAERMLDKNGESKVQHLDPVRIKIEGFGKQTVPFSLRRHFRLDPSDKKYYNGGLDFEEEVFKPNIQMVKSAVEGNLEDDVETASKNAGSQLSSRSFSFLGLNRF